MFRNAILTAALLLAATAMAETDANSSWEVNPIQVCYQGDCAPQGITDIWGPYPDESTCLSRVGDMLETIPQVLFEMYGIPVELRPNGCTNILGDMI